MLRTREDLEKIEAEKLAPYAVKSKDSAGRVHPEAEDDTQRLPFQIDVDRIIWSKSFRRLGGKTQVKEVTDRDDHDRTRMPHELEVLFIAQSKARRLGLNEDLCMAIALGHDLGHTPFGHAGEEELNDIMIEKGYEEGFEHNRHSLYVIDEIEKINPTQETREGLMKHRSIHDQFDVSFKRAPHLEAQVVNRADEIAYTGHDLDDGLRSSVIDIEKLKNTKLWALAHERVTKNHPDIKENDPRYIQKCVSEVIGYLIDDVCIQTDKLLKENDIQSVEDVREYDGELVQFSDEVKVQLKEISDFLKENYYFTPEVQNAHKEGRKIIRELFEIYYNDNSKLPDEHQERIKKGVEPAIAIRDYIAGMTDHFAKETYYEMSKM